jgi:hypothetical protein
MQRFAVFVVVMMALGACHEKQELTLPPPPLRPEAQPVDKKPAVAKDCEPIDPERELKPLTFDQRSIPEGNRLADEGMRSLKSAQSAESDRSTREAYITDAVKNLITALAADPYNVTATYNLAAAYASMGRGQCSLNLLTRLLQMRGHASKHAEVEAQIDRLLGRGKAGSLDPSFIDLRRDERFRTLIAKMCEGSSDATSCVYGSK